MKLLSTPLFIAAGAVTGTAGAMLFRRSLSHNTPAVKKAGKYLLAGILSRGILFALAMKLAKKTILLEACRMRTHQSRLSGLANFMGFFRHRHAPSA